MLEPMHFVTETGTSYASVIEETQSLYLLSFLLTADHDKAEQCLVSAIEECAEGIGFFMDWARLWIRRAVLKHAIQLIMPAPEHADDGTRISLKKPAMWADNIPLPESSYWTRSSVFFPHVDSGKAVRRGMCDCSQMLPARCHDGPRAGSPASVKHGCSSRGGSAVKDLTEPIGSRSLHYQTNSWRSQKSVQNEPRMSTLK
jgi:hypothetical protein